MYLPGSLLSDYIPSIFLGFSVGIKISPIKQRFQVDAARALNLGSYSEGDVWDTALPSDNRIWDHYDG